MPRQPRLNLVDVPQHVVQRGNNRQACFYSEQDYSVYLDKLYLYAKKYSVAVHAFVLMTNHVHLLLTPSTPKAVSKLMQGIGRFYVRYINKTYQRTGTLWEGRFKSTLIDSEQYFLLVSRYIEMNPVRARMVDHPASYPWSSFHSNGLDKDIKLLTQHPCYLALGQNQLERKKAYRALFLNHIAESNVDAIRNATNKGKVLGDSQFKRKVELETGFSLAPKVHGGDRRSCR
ncbi:transposase [Aliiglaciecola sp. LCG003]|uniref:transposase n=1 Tax=Aliiglaciecola sp. LCG003 TaxID=3053655 RepID=UPI0025736A72|nr:transposase [Aliiglaciecola sp. LCG003]WJG08680.1 transposase [Aliiglaciecola sp. LCG003]